MKTQIDTQKEFEYRVCQILKFNRVNSYVMQRKGTEQMILDDFNGKNALSGSLAYKNNKQILLVCTKDSDVNHIESITADMIRLLVSTYCSTEKHKVILATNIPIDIHSSKAKDLKKDHNFNIVNIGYSFCKKHNLEFTQLY